MKKILGLFLGTILSSLVLLIDRSPVSLVIGFWFFVLGYKASGRRFFLDAVPLTIIPAIAVRFILITLVFLYRLLCYWFTNSEQTIYNPPQTWQEFLDSGEYRRELASGKMAIAGWNRRRILKIDFADFRHLLITGITGEGKTTVALNIICSLLAQGPRIFSKVEFSIHDPASVISLWFLELAKVYAPFFSVHVDLEDSFEALEKLVDEMKERTRKLGEQKLTDVWELGLPHKIILLDDPQWYYVRDKSYESLVDQLVGMGRKAGYHVFILTPYGKGDVIATRYRANLRFISAYLPKHAENSVRMPVSQLGKFNFLYQHTERDKPTIFQPYQILPQDIENLVSDLVNKADDPETVALHLFMNVDNCGIRTILEGGLSHYQSLIDTGLTDSIPFPWSEVSRDGRSVKWSAAAYKWAGDFLAGLSDKGIASPADRGRARQPQVNYTQAFNLIKGEL